jgi:hypothetical protein
MDGLLIAAIGLMASVSLGATVVQADRRDAQGGAVRQVDKPRPAKVRLSKRERGSIPAPAAIRVGIRPPLANSPSLANTPQVVQAPVRLAEAGSCGCPVGLSGAPGYATGDVAVTKLVQRICAELQRGGLDVGAEDLEANIVFALDQSGAAKDVQLRALSRFAGYGCGPGSLPVALAGVREALFNQGSRRGTGSIGSGFLNGNSQFSAPVSSVGGGGSSNYSR